MLTHRHDGEKEEDDMWVPKKKFDALEKRIADLECKTQSQQNAILLHLKCHDEESKELKAIFENIKEMFKSV